MIMDQSQYFIELAKDLFSNDKVREVSNTVGFARAIFCFVKYEGYTGEVLSDMNIKVCNDFFRTPTDVGMGLTQNLNINKIFKDVGYNEFFESKLQNQGKNISGGSYWSEVTLVLFADALNLLGQSYGKGESHDLKTMKLQLHQADEFASMILDVNKYHQKFTGSIELKAGYEYTIDVKPIGQISTKTFNAIDKRQRSCLLANEVVIVQTWAG